MQDPGVNIIYHVLLIIMLGLAALFSLGRRLKKYPVCLLPGTSAVKKNGEECSNTPADRPCAPDSGGAQLCSGENDGEEEMRALSAWVAGLTDREGRTVGQEIPLHISRFFPRFHMTDRRATEVKKVYRLAEVAREKLHYVYTGNC